MKFSDNEKLNNDNSTKNSFIKKSILLVLISVLLILFFYELSSLNINVDIPNNNDDTNVSDEIIDVEKENKFKQEYIENYAINDEYIGHLVFESGLVDQYIVQGADNSFYLKHAWDKTSFREGAAFLDYSNDFEQDQNRIIYGHNIAKSLDESQTHMFTPLHILESKKNYESNKIINFYLEDRKEVYIVSRVYLCNIVEFDGEHYIDFDEPNYVIKNYTSNEFDDYLSKIEDREFYDIDETLDYDDKILTLQTCYEDKIDKLIIVSKLIDIEYYD